MPIITFPFDLNVSVQPTDILYVSIPQNNQSGTNHPNTNQNTTPKAIGVVTSVNHATKEITYDGSGYPAVNITSAHYIFFSKDKRTNMSGIIGYFAETEYRNYTKLQAEIFATAVDYVESSK